MAGPVPHPCAVSKCGCIWEGPLGWGRTIWTPDRRMGEASGGLWLCRGASLPILTCPLHPQDLVGLQAVFPVLAGPASLGELASWALVLYSERGQEDTASVPVCPGRCPFPPTVPRKQGLASETSIPSLPNSCRKSICESSSWWVTGSGQQDSGVSSANGPNPVPLH